MGKKKKIVQWQIKNLRDEKIRKNYCEDTYDAIIEESRNIKKRWQNLKHTIIRTATKTLGDNNIAAKKEWITTEIVRKEEIEERRKCKSLNSID